MHLDIAYCLPLNYANDLKKNTSYERSSKIELSFCNGNNGCLDLNE